MTPDNLSPDLWQSLGVFIPAMAIAVGFITYLIRALKEERARNDKLSADLLDLAKLSLPALTESTGAVHESLSMTRSQAEMLGRYDYLLRAAEQRGTP